MSPAKLSMYSPRDLGGMITEPMPGYEDDLGGAQVIDLFNNGAEADEELARAIQEFFDDLVNDLEIMRTAAIQKQNQRNLSARFDRNDRRTRNRAEVTLKDDGDVDELSMDGHLELGVSTGLLATGITVASGYINGQYHERAERFYAFRPIGLTEEGKSLGQALEHFVDWHFNETNFETTSRRRNLCYCKHGTAFMRMELVQPLKWKRSDDTGEWFESPGEVMPEFTLWPIRDVIPVSFSQPDATKWEGLFYLRPNISLSDIEAAEAVYEPQVDAFTGLPLSNRRVSGKYFGLSRLRTAEDGSYKGQNRIYDRLGGLGSGRDDLHNGPVFNMAEWEGTISYEVFLRAHPKVINWFGIKVGLPEVDEEDQDGRRELAARLARIRHWWVAYIVPGSLQAAGDGYGEGYEVLGFDALDLGRHSAYVTRYFEASETEVHGEGICDRGDGVERIHDSLRNSQWRIGAHNARPSALVDKHVTVEKTVREIRKMLMPGGLVEKASGKKLQEMIEFLVLQADPKLDVWIAAAEMLFWQVIGVPKSLVGYATADTLGQDQMNVQQARNLLDDVILRNSREDYRMIRDMIEGLWMALGPEGFMTRLRKIAGLYGIEIEQEIASTDEIWREYRIEHPAAFGKDPAVLGMQIDQQMLAYPGVFDATRMGLASATAKGITGAEEMLATGWPVLRPVEEQRQMAIGHKIMPSPRMDPVSLIEHIQAHILAGEEIESGASRFPPQQQVPLYEQLHNYLDAALVLLQAYAGPIGAMLMQGGGGGAAGGAGPQQVAGPPGAGEANAKKGLQKSAKGAGKPAAKSNAIERQAT